MAVVSQEADTLVRAACAAGLRLAVAESCTGGEVAAAISAVPGASGCFWGSAVVYTAAAKVALSGVAEEILQQDGTVSERTTAGLARAIRQRSGADIGLAVTGWAGPEGDDVGRVFVAVDGPAGARSLALKVAGNRQTVRSTATRALLELALDAVRDAAVPR